MLKANEAFPPVNTASRHAMAQVMDYVYRIPVIGWALEGVLVDDRPKARLAGLFVLLGAPTVTVLLLGWTGALFPAITLAVLSIAALALVMEI